MQSHDKSFSLYGAVHELGARLVEQALEETGGSVARAAKMLGLKHQTLIAMMKVRHEGLQRKRATPEKRLRSIIKEPKE
jgi:transcriptional regulator with GAF, ATPase, and Fis domain